MFRSHLGATENLGSTKYICIKYYEINKQYIEGEGDKNLK